MLEWVLVVAHSKRINSNLAQFKGHFQEKESWFVIDKQWTWSTPKKQNHFQLILWCMVQVYRKTSWDYTIRYKYILSDPWECVKPHKINNAIMLVDAFLSKKKKTDSIYSMKVKKERKTTEKTFNSIYNFHNNNMLSWVENNSHT